MLWRFFLSVMEHREIFIKVVQAAQDIPEVVRASAPEVGVVREGQMPQSYLDFLDRESRLNSRGPKWEDMMKQRRIRMLPYRDAQIADGIIQREGCSYYVMIALESQSVIYWEEW